MEKTISASFRSLQDLEHAAHALRKQGAIDIRVGIRPAQLLHQDSLMINSQQLGNSHAEMAEDWTYTFDVYVEPSRSRQAEDTIAQYGGRFSTSPKS